MLEISPDLGLILDTRHYEALTTLNHFAAVYATQLETNRSNTALYELDVELPNFLTALNDITTEGLGFQDIQGLLTLYLRLAHYLGIRGLWESKLKWGLALLRLAKQGRLGQLIALMNSIGTAYDELDDFETALDFYQQSLELAMKAEISDARLSPSYSNIAVTLWHMGRIDEGLDYAQRALDLERQQGNLNAVAQSLMNMAQMHYERWEMAEGLALAQEARSVAYEVGDVYLCAQFTSAVATHMVANLQFDEAAPVYEEALRILGEIRDEVGLARAQFNYALLLRILKDIERARDLCFKSIATLERYGLHHEAKRVKELLPKLVVEASS